MAKTTSGKVGPTLPYWTNRPVILYHGTGLQAAQDIAGSGVDLGKVYVRTGCYADFGLGFYTTENRDQAEAWAIYRYKRQAAIVTFTVDREKLSRLACLAFGNATNSFWDLVRHHRLTGGANHARPTAPHMYDVVVGPVAKGVDPNPSKCSISNLYDQVSFHTPKAVTVLNASPKQWDRV